MSNPQVEESEELSGPEHYPFSEFAYDICARLITTWVGQIIYRRVDHIFSILEKIARWSVPQEETKTDFCAVPLVRPLPWILFLPALLIMRVIRAGLSFVALLLGKQPIYPWTVVSVLQKTHRKLRALKYRGQKLRRISFVERQAEYQPSWLNRAILILRAVIFIKPDGVSGVIYKPKQNRHHPHCSKYVAGKRTAKQRDEGDSEESMDEATVQQMLDRYADYDGDSTYCDGEASGELSCTSISENEQSTVADEQTQETNEQEIKEQETQQSNKSEKSPEVETTEKDTKEESAKQSPPPEKVTKEKSPVAKQNGSSSSVKPASSEKSSLNAETDQPKEDADVVEEPTESKPSPAEQQQPEQRSMNGSQRSQSANNLERNPSANQANSTSRSVPNLGSCESDAASSNTSTAKDDSSEKIETSPAAATNGNQHDIKARSANESKPATQHHHHHHRSKHYNPNYQGTANGSGTGGGGSRKQRRSNQNYY